MSKVTLLSQYYLHPVTLFLVATCIKQLLLPAYKSTDFDVHRNWLALTKHVPLHKWYIDDFNEQTIHTLDYPPLFAWFEYFLSHSLVTEFFVDKKYISSKCLMQLPDVDNSVDFYTCVIFHRLTVILVGDFIFWIGAWFFASSCCLNKTKVTSSLDRNQIFALMVLNPGILLLDHVHFQYNGMLLGILLASLACLIRGQKQSISWYYYWDIAGAILYVLLLCMKHLYLILAPFYFFYLLRHFCFVPVTSSQQRHLHSSTQNNPQTMRPYLSFCWKRLWILASVTLTVLLLPLMPFLISVGKTGTLVLSLEQLLYMGKRLFPFQRGLCHSYWAGNIWALYLFFNKMGTWIWNRAWATTTTSSLLPTIPPWFCAICLLVSLVPGMICAWEVATQSLLYQARRKKEMTKKSDEASFTKDVSSNAKNTDTQLIFLEGVLYSSLCGFMLSYHVHEKAIMTCILPMTAIACTTSSSSGHTIIRHRFFRLCVYGHFGLLPLLYQSTEGALKLGLYFVYLIWLMYEWEDLVTLKHKMNLLAVGSTSITLIYTEVLHPILCKVNVKFSRWEFLPLLMTSIICAMGLTHGWFESAWKLRQDLHSMIMDK